MLRIITLSDTHTYGKNIEVPEGDVLLHAGDHTFRGTESETKAALKWLDSLPHKHKILIAGNHDWLFDHNRPAEFRGWKLRNNFYSAKQLLAKFPSLTYLQDSWVEIEGLKIYGSPWSPWYYDWAFNFKPKHQGGLYQAATTWAKIPEDTDILLTHTPPHGILDSAYDFGKKGCELLRKRLDDLPKLKLHVFGHIHESFGRQDFEDIETGERITFVNAANNNIKYDPKNLNRPIVVDLKGI